MFFASDRELNTDMGVIQILDITTFNIEGSAQLQPQGTTELTGMIPAVDGSAKYLVWPQIEGWCTVSYVKVVGQSITVRFINAGDNPHTPFASFISLAYKIV